MALNWYSVNIEVATRRLTDTEVDALVEATSGGDFLPGVSVAVGRTDAGGVAITSSIQSPDPVVAAEVILGRVRSILRKPPFEFPDPEIERIDVMTEAYQERWLEEPAEQLLGVSEVAELLGVSRQRVAQLREREDFPKPFVELAAGPIWRRSTLDRFIREWPRKGGRPVGLERELRAILTPQGIQVRRAGEHDSIVLTSPKGKEIALTAELAMAFRNQLMHGGPMHEWNHVRRTLESFTPRFRRIQPVVVNPETQKIVEPLGDIAESQMAEAIDTLERTGYRVEALLEDLPGWTHLLRVNQEGEGEGWVWWLAQAEPIPAEAEKR